MTVHPITITPEASLLDANELIRVSKVRRLPVINNKGIVQGIITDRDLRTAAPSTATTLSKYEANYLTSKIKIKDIMKKSVITVKENEAIEQAALLMYNHHIGGLLVVDDNNQLIGIITETDIFKVFVKIMGLSNNKTRLIVVIEKDDCGVLADIADVFRDYKISISSFVVFPSDEEDYRNKLLIRCDSNPLLKELVNTLQAKGYLVENVLDIGVTKE